MSMRQSPQMFVRKTVNDTLVTSIPPHSNFLRRSPRRHFPPSLRAGKKPTNAAAVLTVLAEMADPPLAHRVGGAGVRGHCLLCLFRLEHENASDFHGAFQSHWDVSLSPCPGNGGREDRGLRHGVVSAAGTARALRP